MNKKSVLGVAVLAFAGLSFFFLNATSDPSPVCPSAGEGGIVINAPTNGTSDVSEVFQKAIEKAQNKTLCLSPGNYLFSKSVLMPNGINLRLLGLGADRNAVRIIWNAGVIPFFSDPDQMEESRIQSLQIENITFDGQSRLDDPRGRAFNVLGASLPSTFVKILNSQFINIPGNLPIWIEKFSAVTIRNSFFSYTKDPGILWSSKIEVSSTTVQNSQDNCLSISRGNNSVRVMDNTFTNCKNAGIFVGGINYDGNPAFTFQLSGCSSTSVGGNCMLTSATNSKYFRYGMKGTNITLKSGAEFVIATIQSYDPSNRSQVNVTLQTPLPNSLNGVKTASWVDGPHFGGQDVTLRRNTISNTYEYGVKISMGANNVNVAQNTISNSGVFTDSLGAVKRQNRFGILVMGWYLGTGYAQRFSENVYLGYNTITNPTLGGIQISSQQTGAARGLTAEFNTISMDNTMANYGVFVDEHPSMPTSQIKIYQNSISFKPNLGFAYGVRVDSPQANLCGVLTQFWETAITNASCAMYVAGSCLYPSVPINTCVN